jgi:hypothetical protein
MPVKNIRPIVILDPFRQISGLTDVKLAGRIF